MREACEHPATQAACVASCAPLCKDRMFFRQHSVFCVSGDYDQALPVDLANGANCPLETANVPAAPEDCASLPITQRVICEEQDRRPQCAENVPELIGRAEAVVSTIDTELEQFGDLLTRNFIEVDNRAALCEFSRTDLDKYYEQATSNPEKLNALQAEAQGIQDCQQKYETYISPQPAVRQEGAAGPPQPEELRPGTTAPSLRDAVVRAVRTDLDRMRPQMQRLSQSVQKFEAAAETIYGIARLHVAVCPAEGTPRPTTVPLGG